MSTVEDRITAALGQHYAVSFGLCLCGWQTTRTKIGESWRPEFDEHQASVIASLPNIAIIEVPSVRYKAQGETDAERYSTIARRVAANYDVGGSNSRAAVSELLRRVSESLDAAGGQQ